MANQPEAAPVRGLLLIGAALLIGALFLSKGFDSGGVTISASDLPSSDTTVPSGQGTGTQTTDDTTEVIPGTGTLTTLVAPASLLVYVANGSGVSGAAAITNAALTAAGYTAAIPPEGSAPATTTTIVYYFEDATTSYQADAAAVAGVIGAQPTSVQPMPAEGLGFDIKNAVVVVVLGPDLAQPAA